MRHFHKWGSKAIRRHGCVHGWVFLVAGESPPPPPGPTLPTSSPVWCAGMGKAEASIPPSSPLPVGLWKGQASVGDWRAKQMVGMWF